MSDEQLGLARDRALRRHVLACRYDREGQRETGKRSVKGTGRGARG